MVTKTTAKGMRDFLPSDMQTREYAINQIKSIYAKFGFNLIETPCVENLQNLQSNQGGENEKLIFKILKRGLEKNTPASDACDLALRYDLTMPLARYYAANAGLLPPVFKSLQIGNVWRADRPQKARYRQFMQCDLDIIGSSDPLCEIELISAFTSAIRSFNITDIVFQISDRAILASILPKEKLTECMIILDKLDKIGDQKVTEELNSLNLDGAKILTAVKESKPTEGLQLIIDSLKQVGITATFTPTLTRGMGYYTGTIFEAYSPSLGCSIGGGGRYDNMISLFTGKPTPACGISIGLERLFLILDEQNYKIPSATKICVLCGKQDTMQAIKKATELRKQNFIVDIQTLSKNLSFQIDNLKKLGYTKVIIIDGEFTKEKEV